MPVIGRSLERTDGRTHGVPSIERLSIEYTYVYIIDVLQQTSIEFHTHFYIEKMTLPYWCFHEIVVMSVRLYGLKG